ncbi:hypothetical protein DPMN_080011 [Dreissena polymorpha]|uniref:Uncharacterized protein n=1 Tax=Dreissena polymorpha TaxID=45954 RepID=A0A9D3YU79_DREPO|nr:hypothetical protein DPMN_080011 [Dreissena polymorpha]
MRRSFLGNLHGHIMIGPFTEYWSGTVTEHRVLINEQRVPVTKCSVPDISPVTECSVPITEYRPPSTKCALSGTGLVTKHRTGYQVLSAEHRVLGAEYREPFTEH